MVEAVEVQAAPITIKKYANRRLYNTATSSYVTLEHLCQMVKAHIEFTVYDAKTGEDITRSVLTQIIVEEESKGQNLLPINFLRQLIAFYGDKMQWMVPGYLDYSMQAFSRNQGKMKEYFQSSLGGIFPFGGFEEVGKQNLVVFERAMRMFFPFAAEFPRFPGLPDAGIDTKGEERRPETLTEKSLEELQRQLDLVQQQLAALSRTQAGGGGT
ncbi:Polyhydroxyalkanoate synthesis repressor [uncultured Gammaproteobacteria bacterium]